MSAPPATTVTANPMPRTAFTAKITGNDETASSTSAGAPSRIRPPARAQRYPTRATIRGVTSSPATVATNSAPFASPAAPFEPVASAKIGITASGR